MSVCSAIALCSFLPKTNSRGNICNLALVSKMCTRGFFHHTAVGSRVGLLVQWDLVLHRGANACTSSCHTWKLCSNVDGTNSVKECFNPGRKPLRKWALLHRPSVRAPGYQYCVRMQHTVAMAQQGEVLTWCGTAYLGVSVVVKEWQVCRNNFTGMSFFEHNLVLQRRRVPLANPCTKHPARKHKPHRVPVG